MLDHRYDAQVRLLLRCLPSVQREARFALKGGTAINLFLRDLPRISVDIDLCYLPLEPRESALREIDQAMARPQGAWKLQFSRSPARRSSVEASSTAPQKRSPSAVPAPAGQSRLTSVRAPAASPSRR